MAHRVVHIRIDEETSDGLAALVGELGASQSVVARNLLRAALKIPAQRAVASELTYSAIHAQKRALGRITQILQKQLPAILDEELQTSAG